MFACRACQRVYLVGPLNVDISESPNNEQTLNVWDADAGGGRRSKAEAGSLDSGRNDKLESRLQSTYTVIRPILRVSSVLDREPHTKNLFVERHPTYNTEYRVYGC